MALGRLRGHLPLVVFILLAVVCLLLIGFACACLTDHPMQAIDRAIGAFQLLAAPLEVWPLVVLSLLAFAGLATGRRYGPRPSPAVLQRFLL